MKRYILFAGSDYYPTGGWDDFVNSFDDMSLALAATKRQDPRDPAHFTDICDWWHIVDAISGEITHDSSGFTQRLSSLT